MHPNSDEGIFLGYFINNKAYRVYKKRTKVVMESINMVVYDTLKDKEKEEDEVPPQQIDVPTNVPPKESDLVNEITNSNDLQINKGPSIKFQINKGISYEILMKEL